MPYLVENEKGKYIANALDRASTGCVITGIFVPVAGKMFGQLQIDLDYLVAAVVLWAVSGAILHIEGRRVLDGLQE
jgi:hypothetical protein